jgi:hypothetical protein
MHHAGRLPGADRAASACSNGKFPSRHVTPAATQADAPHGSALGCPTLQVVSTAPAFVQPRDLLLGSRDGSTTVKWAG